jgi:hypothetical protein
MSGVVEAGDAGPDGTTAPRQPPPFASPSPPSTSPSPPDAIGIDGHTQEAACLNCGTRLLGDYCHACGQRAHVHRTLSALGHDLLHGVLHFEGKIWRTLPLLIWRPGVLTRRYIAGERARFVSPLALFLFSVFVMFAAFGLSQPGQVSTTGGPVATLGTGDVAAELDRLETRVAEARARQQAARASGQGVAEADRALAQALRDVETARGFAMLVQTQGDGPGARTTGWPALDAAIAKVNANPGLAFYKLQSNAYKFSWALIPISVPLVWLLFAWKRQFRLYDHAVFVTYSLAFMTLLVVTLTVLDAMGVHEDALAIAGGIVVPVHMARQMRDAYRLRWWSAIARTTVLLALATAALTLFSLLVLALVLTG